MIRELEDSKILPDQRLFLRVDRISGTSINIDNGVGMIDSVGSYILRTYSEVNEITAGKKRCWVVGLTPSKVSQSHAVYSILHV